MKLLWTHCSTEGHFSRGERRSDNSASPTVLMTAVRCGHDKIVKRLLSAGADVNAEAESGRTALGVAAIFGRVQCIHLLVQHGACLTRRTRDWESTPLEDAMSANQVSAVECLKRLASNAMLRNNNGKILNDTASRGSNAVMISHLSVFTTEISPVSARTNSSPSTFLGIVESSTMNSAADAITILGSDEVDIEGYTDEAGDGSNRQEVGPSNTERLPDGVDPVKTTSIDTTRVPILTKLPAWSYFPAGRNICRSASLGGVGTKKGKDGRDRNSGAFRGMKKELEHNLQRHVSFESSIGTTQYVSTSLTSMKRSEVPIARTRRGVTWSSSISVLKPKFDAAD